MTMSNRRNFIRSSLGGSLLYSGIATDLLARQEADALAPRGAHFPGKAKKLFLFSLVAGYRMSIRSTPNPRSTAIMVNSSR